MRARLQKMQRSQEYSFICDDKVAEKIGRVVAFAGGVIQSREKRGNGTVIKVIKEVATPQQRPG